MSKKTKTASLVDELSPTIDQQVLDLSAGPPEGDELPEVPQHDDTEADDDEPTAADLEPFSVRAATFSVPIAAVSVQGFTRRRIDVRLSRRQGDALKRIMLALQSQDARLADRRPIKNVTDAVRWLIDQVA